VNAGGLVGYAHASTFDRSGNVANGVSATGTADNAEATALSVTANGGTSAAAGAFCGSFDASSIDDSKPTAASADAASAVTSTGATVTVTATNAASTYAGGFAGSATGSSTIKDAFQTATPVAASDNGGAFTVNAQGPGWGTSWAGGLIGYLNASTVSAVSPSLAAQTAVTANDKTAYAGGLIGQAEKSSVTGLNGAIAGDSFNVSATSTDGGGKAWAGGLIGSLANASTFGGSNAVFKAQTASITANAPAAAYAGGLAGQTDNSALSSSNLAFGSGAFSVNAAADAGWGRGWAGGAIGQANSSSVTSLTQTVDGTSGDAALSVDATGNSSRAGGFAGDITGTRNGIGLAYDTLALSSGAHQATLTVGSADTLHAAGFAGWLSGTSMAHCALSSDNVTTGRFEGRPEPAHLLAGRRHGRRRRALNDREQLRGSQHRLANGKRHRLLLRVRPERPGHDDQQLRRHRHRVGRQRLRLHRRPSEGPIATRRNPRLRSAARFPTPTPP
jgi:hypothetical protein